MNPYRKRCMQAVATWFGAAWLGPIPESLLMAQQAKLRATLVGSEKRAVYSVAFSSNGKTLASSGDRTVRLWDVPKGTMTPALHGHTDEIFSVAFSPDGKTLVSGGEGKSLRLWTSTNDK